MTTQEGRAPTATELQFFEDCGLEIGFDVDDPSREFQLSHVCWPYPLRLGPLCRSEKVWFQSKYTGALFRVVCAECLTKLAQLQKKDPVLLRAIGTLSNSLRIHYQLEGAFDTFVLIRDNPDKAILPMALKDLEAVEEVLREIDSDWKNLSTSTLSAMMTEDWWKLP